MAITTKNPASDLAAALTGQTVGGVALTSGVNLFGAPIHPMPMALSVQIINSGGAAPQPFVSPTASAYFQASAQAIVYGTPGEDGYTTAEALARGLVGFLQQASVSGYVSVLAEGMPGYLGVEASGQRHQWSVNFSARYVA